MSNMVHVKENLYRCLTTLRYFRRFVIWERGDLVTLWEDAGY